MMKVFFNAFFWIILFCSTIFTQTGVASADVFLQANERYKNAAYDSAVSLYEQLLLTEKSNYVIHYNLGNAYYKLNKPGKAILHYERALQLQPDDEEVLHNLEVARKQTVDKLRPVPQLAIVKGWHSLLATFNSYGWGITALILIWGGFLCWAVYLLVISNKYVRFIGSLLMLASLVPLLLGVLKYQREHASGYGILTTSNAYVKSAPDENASNLFIIHEGIKVKMLDQVRPWIKVRLEDGKTGWIKAESAEFI